MILNIPVMASGHLHAFHDMHAYDNATFSVFFLEIYVIGVDEAHDVLKSSKYPGEGES